MPDSERRRQFRRVDAVSKQLAPPSDFMDRAAHRLGRGALVLCIFFSGLAALTVLVPWLLDTERRGPVVIISDLALAALCGLVAVTILRKRINTAFAIRLGVALELAGALLLSLFIYMTPLSQVTDLSGLSGVSVWVLVMPFLVPVPPRRRAVLSLSAASMPLLVLGVLDPMFGYGSPSVEQFTQVALSNWLTGILGLAISAQINTWGTEIAKARHEAEMLGSYQLIEKLGEGGMGEVWLAQHRMLARPAAVKFIRQGKAPNQHAVERFEREARATAQLTSPNTVRIYDYGVDESRGEFFYVMEMLDGLDLDTFIDQYGPMEPPRAIHIAIQICKSLAEAHDHGLIHRDIKPANIYLCAQGGEHDVVKVLDFGLVLHDRRRSTANQPKARLTEDGLVTGTPGFMAPEAARGKDDLTHSVDIYSFGCLLFWLLTGQPIVEEAGRTAMDVLIAHIKEAPRRASAFTSHSIDPALDAVIQDCVAKDPAERPTDMRQIAARLAACAEATWTENAAREWWANHGEAEDIDRPSTLATATNEHATP
ncbi:MAG: serine/threonine-protein kinase [Planctomycetota bacterium]|jgi:tRNA A-37 threonylcarbamoyl transferase component Bud32|nr:serine/threonine-protein kinase [Planctomycetota bacterium]